MRPSEASDAACDVFCWSTNDAQAQATAQHLACPRNADNDHGGAGHIVQRLWQQLRNNARTSVGMAV